MGLAISANNKQGRRAPITPSTVINQLTPHLSPLPPFPFRAFRSLVKQMMDDLRADMAAQARTVGEVRSDSIRVAAAMRENEANLQHATEEVRRAKRVLRRIERAGPVH